MAQGDPTVARGLAANPVTPLGMLMQLAAGAADSHTLARAFLKRKELPAPVARILAGHPDAQIRRSLARHRSTPDEIRFGLAEDPDPAVRAELADWPPDYLDWPHPTPTGNMSPSWSS